MNHKKKLFFRSHDFFNPCQSHPDPYEPEHFDRNSTITNLNITGRIWLLRLLAGNYRNRLMDLQSRMVREFCMAFYIVQITNDVCGCRPTSGIAIMRFHPFLLVPGSNFQLIRVLSTSLPKMFWKNCTMPFCTFRHTSKLWSKTGSKASNVPWLEG